ncbi:hypothetical protein ASG39_22345 [Rhizobium sp. Leaf371]|uniref:hypothetical protein n=1 Tax=Rhizobium sp. Leaf371 TaxID=1736355 RepID=UPI000715A4AA|nr:hypothetical protein [Rhizobium sp. Leaf371]KQS69445.1 hypothetical protein ASG39_22345 [Rhizobium sp. Leaf371]
MSSKKPSIKHSHVFATDEWGGKAAYRSLSPRSHEAFDHTLSPLAGRRSFRMRRVLVMLVKCLMLVGLAIALLLAVI